MSSPPPEMSGRKFLLFFLFPAIIIFGIVLKVLGPDKPLGGPSSLLPQRAKPSPTPAASPTPTPGKAGTEPAAPASPPATNP